MSVDWGVIDHASFWSDAEDIEELNLSNKNIENLGVCLPALSSLRVLNLAVETIQTLNLSHNSLDSINPLSALEGLETLKLSFNNLKSLQPLSFCNRLKILDGTPLVPRCGRRRSVNGGVPRRRPPKCALPKSHSLGSTRGGTESVCPSLRSSFDGASTASLISAVSSKVASVSSRSSRFTDLNKLPARCLETSSTATFQDVIDGLSSLKLKPGTLLPPLLSLTRVFSISKNLQSFLSAQNKFSTASLPPKPRRSAKPKPVVSRSDSLEKEIVYQQKYAGSLANSQNMVAVAIRREGSAEVKWPNGQIAVSVDVETMQEKPQYRLFATHRGSSLVAASFEPNGNGFVQDKEGKMLLRVSNEGKKGQVYQEDGALLSSWDHYDGTKMTSDSTTVDMPLSKDMGIRYCIVSARVEVYILCETVRQMDQWPDTDSGDCPPFVHEMMEPKKQKKIQPTVEVAETSNDVTIDSLNSALIHLTSNIKRLLAEPI
ncbi:hypothetical protein BSKO_03618 [Bryopsis sp. KO-2023]|nr:hypothetical protein BSKO_03618 [Bryopsis sp. KO-2023]